MDHDTHTHPKRPVIFFLHRKLSSQIFDQVKQIIMVLFCTVCTLRALGNARTDRQTAHIPGADLVGSTGWRAERFVAVSIGVPYS
jgi:hypothetical protein